MAGLVVAGPWLTMVGSRIMARRADRPAGLIAGRRLSDNPRAAFRAISGLIIALFVTSVSVGVIGTMQADHDTSGGGAGAGDTLIQQFAGGSVRTCHPVKRRRRPRSLLRCFDASCDPFRASGG